MAQSDKPKPPSLKQQAEQLRRELQVQLSSPSPSTAQADIQQPSIPAQKYPDQAAAHQIQLATLIIIIIIVLAVLLGVMIYTNPTIDDFRAYIRQTVIKESEKDTNDVGMTRFLGTIIGPVTATVVTSQTVRTDYVIFSLYEARFGTEKLRVLGICRNFIVLESPMMK